MNYFKRAMCSINRKKGKTFILFMIVFILGNLIAGAVSIQQATKSVEKTTKEKLGSSITIDFDYEKIQKETEKNPDYKWEPKPIALEMIEKIGKHSSVKYFDYNVMSYLKGGTIKPYMPSGDLNGGMSPEEQDFPIKGVNYAPILDFQEKKMKLVDGTVFSESDIAQSKPVAIISKKVAEENNLSIGSTFTLKNNILLFGGEEDMEGGDQLKIYSSRDVVLEVKGIFEQIEYKKKDGNNKKDLQGISSFLDMEALNRIYVPNGITIAEAQFTREEYLKQNSSEEIRNDIFYAPIYVLKNVDDVDSFVSDVQKMITEEYKIASSTDAYDSIAAPIKSMASISNIVLWVSIVASLIIISLIVILFLRDRKQEFGIYLSLGEKKRKVLSQVVIEVVIIAFVGITISMVSGNILAKSVSKTMIADQLKEGEDDMNGGFMYMPLDLQTDMTKEEVAEAYEVALTVDYILVFYVIGLGTVILSTLAPMIYITRLNPKKILL